MPVSHPKWMMQKLGSPAKLMSYTRCFGASEVSNVNAPIRYQFLIEGDVLNRVSVAFPDTRATPTAGGYTSLGGPIPDYLVMRS